MKKNLTIHSTDSEKQSYHTERTADSLDFANQQLERIKQINENQGAASQAISSKVSSKLDKLGALEQQATETQGLLKTLINEVKTRALPVELVGLEQVVIQGDKGVDGKDGKDGKDGRDGIDGKSIAGPQGLPGKDGIDGRQGPQGEPGLNGSPDTSEEIIEKIKFKFSYDQLKDKPKLYDPTHNLLGNKGGGEGGGGRDITWRDSTGAIVSQHVTDIKFSTGITPTYSNGVITLTSPDTGTVTSVTSANGAASVANQTTTPVITIVSAPILTTARTIGGVSFDGSANITVATATGGFTVSGGNLVVSSADATINSLTVGKGTNSVTNNTALGENALAGANSGAGNNTAIGVSALTANTSGHSNTAVGSAALDSNTTGDANTAIGLLALSTVSTGDNNTAVGYGSLIPALGSGNVAIGFFSGRYETGSNAFYVNNQDQGTLAADRTDSLMYGTFNATVASQTLTINAQTTVSVAGGNISWGVYTPTRSAEVNLDSNVTMTEAQYMRVGNTCTVSGRFTADPTTTATLTSFEITLPVASDIGAAEDAAGVAFCGAIAGQGAAIFGVVANDTAKVSWIAGDVTSQIWSYTFSYQII